MKVAVCLSGYLRKYKDLYGNFESCILRPLREKGYEVDIFLSTWTETNSNSCFSSKQGNGEYEGEKITNWTEVNCLYNILHGTAYDFEAKKEQFDIKKYDPHVDLKNLHPNIHEDGVLFGLAMFYHRYRCNWLKSSHEVLGNFRYDYVIMMRPDLFFLKPLDIENINPNLLNGRTHYSDLFFIASSEIIDQVAGVWLNVQNIVNRHGHNKFEWFEVYCPEHFLEWHLKDVGIGLPQRCELGEDFCWVYPRRHFFATCAEILAKIGRIEDINKVYRYFEEL